MQVRYTCVGVFWGWAFSLPLGCS
ncbi:hypothetical protein CLUP02_10606 [Colletotrichum lupini]|uniref:Uncharacterized protein n=1 Tax=Colletotrichum lupini TaxID=145971 RepID=A0A9Q8SX83_9PEZI|nr:hypothetical protein CLUP02_10606 [Colletotrichum lupini]